MSLRWSRGVLPRCSGRASLGTSCRLRGLRGRRRLLGHSRFGCARRPLALFLARLRSGPLAGLLARLRCRPLTRLRCRLLARLRRRFLARRGSFRAGGFAVGLRTLTGALGGPRRARLVRAALWCVAFPGIRSMCHLCQRTSLCPKLRHRRILCYGDALHQQMVPAAGAAYLDAVDGDRPHFVDK